MERADFRVVIIGAGMSGILMAIRLRDAGIHDFTVYEKGGSVGGTWRENTYPGLHCDVASHHYCYSFAPNPEWSRHFSGGPEIRDYFEDTAERFGVLSAVRLNTEVLEACWRDGKWRISLPDGEHDQADILVSAAGVLHVPTYPDIPGLKSFAGPAFHTARWDHDVTLADKRIGIIGTGSTAIQIVTELAGNVEHLTLFQRTPQWVVPLPNPEFSEAEKTAFRTDPALVQKTYAEIRDAQAQFVSGAVMGKNPDARRALEEAVESNLASVRDPDLRKKLTPGYKPGCKRLVLSPGFYEAIQKPDTTLVTERIARIEEGGVVTADGAVHALDVLVLATGFDPNAFMRPLKLYGRDGISLDDLWAERPIAYHSMAVPDMPNFFMLEGPFSPIGNLSLVMVSEWQADYIMRCIEIVRRESVALSPSADATARLMSRYRGEARNTIWATGGCKSWYQDKDGVPIIYPFSPEDFRAETNVDPDLDDFVVEHMPARVG